MSTSREYDKNYYSASLDKILSKYITSKQYGDLVPIVKDVFQRRAYEFDFSDKHIEAEVRKFIKNAKTIEFVSEDEIGKSTTMGVYKSGKKKIQLNETYYSSKLRNYGSEEVGKMLYETLTHEMYHAIADGPVHSGVSTYNVLKNDYEGDTLNEVITEAAANRTSYTRTSRDFEQGRSKTDGYSDITFVANLLAASMGVTEKEFLKAGIQNRKELMNLFNSKFPSNSLAKTAQKEYFDKIESSLDVIYNLNYEKTSKNEPKELKSQLRKSALTTLYKSAYELALFQISHDKAHTPAEMADEASFRFLKMENILMDSSKYFRDGRYISGQDYNSMHNEIYKTRQMLGAEVLRLTGKRSFRELNRYDVYDNSYGKMVMREDFANGKRWNNTFVSRLMVQQFDKTYDSEERFGDTEPIPIAANQEPTEPIPVIDDDKTEPIPVVDDDKTEPMDVLEDTEPMRTVSNQKENKKSLLDGFKQTIDIIITRFKNRRLAKLNEAREDKSEYYANLVNNTISRDSGMDKYKVNVNSLHVENMTVGTEERKDERNQDEER